MNSIDQILETYYVDIKEYNPTTGKLDLVEYFKYEVGYYIDLDSGYLCNRISDETVNLAVF